MPAVALSKLRFKLSAGAAESSLRMDAMMCNATRPQVQTGGRGSIEVSRGIAPFHVASRVPAVGVEPTRGLPPSGF